MTPEKCERIVTKKLVERLTFYWDGQLQLLLENINYKKEKSFLDKCKQLHPSEDLWKGLD